MFCPCFLCPGSWIRRPLLFADSWPTFSVLLPAVYPLMLQLYFIVLFPKQVYILYVIDYMYVKMSWESFRKKLASFKVQLSIPSLPWNSVSFLGKLYSFNCVLAYFCSLDLLLLNWSFLLDSSLQNRTCYHVWRCFSACCSQIQWLWNQTQSKYNGLDLR